MAAALGVLETDPYVNFGGKEWYNSVPYQELSRRGYKDVRRLKSWDLGDLRVFYIVVANRHTVLIKEIVHKDQDTYAAAAPHVKRIIKNWRMYFAGERSQ